MTAADTKLALRVFVFGVLVAIGQRDSRQEALGAEKSLTQYWQKSVQVRTGPAAIECEGAGELAQRLLQLS